MLRIFELPNMPIINLKNEICIYVVASYFKTCNLMDPKLNDCARKTAQDAIETFINGMYFVWDFNLLTSKTFLNLDPGLGTSLNPFKIASFDLTDRKRGITTLRQNYTNNEFYGLDKLNFKEVTLVYLYQLPSNNFVLMPFPSVSELILIISI